MYLQKHNLNKFCYQRLLVNSLPASLATFLVILKYLFAYMSLICNFYCLFISFIYQGCILIDQRAQIATAFPLAL